jgi:hypothetical protein
MLDNNGDEIDTSFEKWWNCIGDGDVIGLWQKQNQKEKDRIDGGDLCFPMDITA